MAVFPELLVFLKSVYTSQQGNTDHWIADAIAYVFTTHGSTTFSGGVTNNTIMNKLVWKLLKQPFCTVSFLGVVYMASICY